LGAKDRTRMMLAESYFGNVIDWITDSSHWRGSDGVPHRLVEHLEISAVSLVIALLIAIPLGLVLGHFRRGGFAAVNVANLGRAIPALSILLLAVSIWGISDPPHWLRSIGVVSFPAFIALVALAIPPVLTNTYIGVTGIDQNVRDAARGMGMGNGQMLRKVELPLATPLIMTGIRTSAVAVIATATLLAYVGGGGLGRFIIDGAAISFSDPRIFVGALFVAILSMAVEAILAFVQRFVVPAPLQRQIQAGPDARVRVAA
jgi:osmoprotectant transport system permease protein